MKLSQIASSLGVTLENGDPDAEIIGVAGIEEAAAGQITFVANPKYAANARTTAAAAVIVAEDFPAIASGMLRSKNPYLTFARAIDLFHKTPSYVPGIHPTAVIDRTARIGKDAHVAAYVVVGEDVQIGDGAVLLPHVVIYRGARIGANFFAHAHSVVREYCILGDDVTLAEWRDCGLRWLWLCAGRRSLGKDHAVRVRRCWRIDVEVQANACIDRASIGETRIKRGTKIDNLVQVGHGSAVGENTLLCSQVGLAGSTVVGNNVILAGQVGVAGHCFIGDGVIVTAQSGTHGDIPAGSMVSGSPAFDHKQWLRAVNLFNKLPELAKAVRNLRASQEKSAKPAENQQE